MKPDHKTSVIAFANWYTNAWERSPYDATDAEVHVMWMKWQGWLQSLEHPHCGDCTKVPAPCTRCHTEEYLKFAEIVGRITSEP